MSQERDEHNWWLSSDEETLAKERAESGPMLKARIEKLEADLSTLLFRHAAKNNEYNALKAQIHCLLEALSEMDGFRPPQEIREMLEGL